MDSILLTVIVGQPPSNGVCPRQRCRLLIQFQNPVMKISITPLHKIYNYILI